MEDLKLKIDSKAAQADILALSKALDRATASASKMEVAFAKAATSADVNLTKAARAMEKYASVANLLSKIKNAGNPVGHIQEMAAALDAMGRARTVSPEKLAGIRQMAVALSLIKPNSGIFAMAEMINGIGKAKFPTNQQVVNLEKLFVVIGNAKEFPNARRVANDLNEIASAANRASAALNRMPRNAGSVMGRGNSAGGTGVVGQAAGLNRVLEESEPKGKRAAGTFAMMGNGLTNLSGRFRLTYQAGTLFSTLFTSFTLGAFVGGLYQANIQLLKLQKAMLFATGTFAGAEKATSSFIGIAQKLGLSIKDNIDTYGRFVIAATASDLKLNQTNSIYESLATALTVVGSSAKQQQLAFYGLTEMMQKGVVYSKEFNRQIGAQLPGNAVIGAQALSKLEGHFVSVTDFFKQMHSGTLLSATFIPEWAKAVREMYEPLLSLAQQRPDVALSRLKNTFFIFAREVGGGKFMSSIGSELKNLTSLIITGDGANAHLTVGMQKLADTLGKNLADTIHAVGTGLEFLIKHLDTILTLLKAFVAYKLAGEFIAWSVAAGKAAQSVGTLASYIRGLAGAEATEGAVSTVSTGAGGLGGYAAMMAGRAERAAASTRSSRAITNMTTTEAIFGKRAAPAAAGTLVAVPSGFKASGRIRGFGDVAEIAGSDASKVAIAGESALPGVAAADAAAVSLSGALGGLGVVIAGTAAVLFAIRDKASGQKTSQGHDILYSDLEDATFKEVMDSVHQTLDDLAGGFNDFGNSLLKFFGVSTNGAKIFAAIAGTLQALFVGLYDEIAIPIRIAWAGIKSTVDVIVGAAKALSDIAQGRPVDAYNDYKAAKTDIGNSWKSAWDGSLQDLSGANTIHNAQRIAGGAVDSANARVTQEGISAANKQIEASIQQQAAAKANREAAELMQDTMEEYNKDNKPLDFNKDILPLFQTLVDGSAFNRINAKPHISGEDSPEVTKLKNTPMTDPHYLEKTSAAALYTDARGYRGDHLGDEGLQTLFGTNQITLGLDPEKVKWCAAFVNAVLADNGHPTTHSLAASSFRNYGQEEKNPIPGDIVVLKPQEAGSTGHVGFYSGMDAKGNVLVTGGNQNNEVNTSPFKASDVLSYRRPDQYAAQFTNPQSALNALDSDEEAVTPQESPAKALEMKMLGDRKELDKFISGGGPIAAAAEQMQEEFIGLKKIFANQIDLMTANHGLKSVVNSDDLKAMQAANERIAQKNFDVVQPIEKSNRVMAEGNAITALRVKGLDAQADLMELTNKLTEEGYTAQQIANMTGKEAVAIGKQTQATLAAQLDLQKQLNQNTVASFARNNNDPFQNAMMKGLEANAAKNGGTIDQARARMSIVDPTTGTSEYNVMAQNVQAQIANRTAEAAGAMADQIQSLQETYANNPTANKLNSDYKSALEQMTGLSKASLAVLNDAASQDEKDFALNWAKAKQQLENPPGFQKWVDGLEPFEKRMEDIKASFAEGLSNALSDIATGDEKPGKAFKKLFDDTRKEWMKAQTDTLLGGAFKALGIASPNPETPEQKAVFDMTDTFDKKAVAPMADAAVTLQTGATTLQQAASAMLQVATQFGQINSDVSNTLDSANGTLATALTGGSGTGGGIPALRGALDVGGSGSDAGSGFFGGALPGGTQLMQSMGLGNGSTPTFQPYSNASLQALGPNVGSSLLPTSLPSLNGAGTIAAQNAAAQPGILDSLGSLFGGSDVSGVNITPNQMTGTYSDGSSPNPSTLDLIGNLFGIKSSNSTSQNIGNGLLGAVGTFGGLIENLLKPPRKPPLLPQTNVLGTMSTNTVTGTQQAEQPNILGSLLNMVAQAMLGQANGAATATATAANTGVGGYLGALGNNLEGQLSTDWAGISNFASNAWNGATSLFKEGGFTTQPVEKVMTNASFRDAPHYAEGTPNTDGIPAIVHPNEAVIPLSRNRKIPIEGGMQSPSMNSNITIIAPNPDAFRQSKGAIIRDQNRLMKRNSLRNLTGTL
jgi:uncharacterized protein (TIGR02594 family)